MGQKSGKGTRQKSDLLLPLYSYAGLLALMDRKYGLNPNLTHFIFRLDKPNLKVKQVNMNPFVGVDSSGQVRNYLNVGQCTSQALACETDQFVNRAQQAHFDGPKDMAH